MLMMRYLVKVSHPKIPLKGVMWKYTLKAPVLGSNVLL